jgi:predicted nucleic acid-binding protein
MTEVVVLDSGAVERIESSKILRGILRRLVDRGADVVIPAVVLAETVTGRGSDATVNRVVARFGTIVTPEAIALRAGVLRHRLPKARRKKVSAIDAVVAAHAVLSAAPTVLLTTDVDDLEALVSAHRHVQVEPA